MSLLAKLTAPNARPRRTRPAGLNPYRAVADLAGLLGHYQDIPLRFQKQWISSFLTIVVLVGLVAGLYLNVTARAAITGREIQNLEAEIVINERVNADLQTDLAILLSNNVLEDRALTAGFVPFERADLGYLVVPGYFPPQSVKLSAPADQAGEMTLAPEYTESLFDWISHQIEAASLPLAQVP